MSKRIERMFKQGDRFHEGWYYRARSWCDVVAADNGVSVEKVAGVLAALSPGVSWERNKLECKAMVEGREDVTFTTYPIGVRKARAILDGAPVLETLKPHKQSGCKTANFYRCIINPGDRDSVVIDRHAISICLGRAATEKERSIKAGKYRMYADRYRRTARRLNITPSQLQAITWESWREDREVAPF